MTTPLEPALAAAAKDARAWPFEEARRIVKRLESLKGGADKTVIFETGYGPSGLPHIGTFGEVARTAMVRHAFEVLTEGRIKTRLICFSDDMDGLRKVPDNVPNKDMLAAYLDKPLSARSPIPSATSTRALPRTTTHACAASSTGSASSTSSCRRPSATRPASFDETLLKMLAGLRQGDGHHPADARAPSAAPPTRRSCRCRPTHRQGAAGADGRARCQEGHRRLRRSRHGEEGRDAGDGRRASSASGRPTGPCAGPRSASTTRCAART